MDVTSFGVGNGGAGRDVLSPLEVRTAQILAGEKVLQAIASKSRP